MKQRLRYWLLLCYIVSYFPLRAAMPDQAKKIKVLYILEAFPRYVQTFFIDQLYGCLSNKDLEVTILAGNGSSKPMPLCFAKFDMKGCVFYDRLPEEKREHDIVYYTTHYAVHRFKKLRDELTGKVVVGFHGARNDFVILPDEAMRSTYFKDADYILTACRYAREKLIERGCDPEKVLFLPVGVNCEKFAFTPKEYDLQKPFRIISVARLVDIKGIEYGIKAVARLIRKGYKIEYRISGNGPLLYSLQKLARQLEVTEHVTFLGFQSHDNVVKEFAKAHCCIQPSVRCSNVFPESLPTVLKESMASGVVAVSSQGHGGIPELIEDGENGFLVVERDPEALADVIEYQLLHYQDSKDVLLAARKKVVAEYEMKKTNKQLVEFFYEIAGYA